MQFRLTYRGPLKGGNSKDRDHIHAIRRHFHRQLTTLWQQMPLVEHQDWLVTPRKREGEISLPTQRGAFTFVPLVSDELHVHAELDILLLRPAPPGALLRDGGDLDNRIKTLIDCLRVPSPTELPVGDAPKQDEVPHFYCLLSDDKLVSAFSVRSDRLLDPTARENDVEVVIAVRTRNSRTTWGNISITG